MKRLLFLIGLTIFFKTLLFADSPSTPMVVEQLYSTLKKLSNTSNEIYAFDYREQIKDCFRGKEDSGIPVPNDFYEWGYKAHKSLPANQYANMFYELAYQKKSLKVEKYTIGSSKYVSEVELGKYLNQNKVYIQTIVKKTFTDGTKKSRTFSDTLLVENGEVVQFRNAILDSEVEDIEALRRLAASYYSSKLYYRAYKTYEKIISLDPANANAYYRLSLMTYWRQGCSYREKFATKKAIEYANKAKILGYDSQKTETVLYYYKHPQSI